MERQQQRAAAGVIVAHMTVRHRLDHDEMDEAAVGDHGQRLVAQIFQRPPVGCCVKAVLSGECDQRARGEAKPRRARLLAQLLKSDGASVVGKEDRQGCQPALRGLALTDIRRSGRFDPAASQTGQKGQHVEAGSDAAPLLVIVRSWALQGVRACFVPGE